MTSWIPTPLKVLLMPPFSRFLSPSRERAENLLGMTLIFHPFSSLRENVSGGVLLSLPGQKGQVSEYCASAGLSDFTLKSSGLLALSLAIITHSRVIRFNRSSDIHPPILQGQALPLRQVRPRLYNPQQFCFFITKSKKGIHKLARLYASFRSDLYCHQYFIVHTIKPVNQRPYVIVPSC